MLHRCLGARVSRWLVVSAAIGCSSDDLGTPRTLDVTRADVQAAVSSNSELALALVGALRGQTGNLIYSPLSLEAVLGMLHAGARGETASQLGALLGAADDAALLHSGLGLLLDDVGGDDHGYTLDLANRLFVAEGLSVLPDYTALLRDAYHAPQQTLDYSDSEAARSTINRWVAERTRDKIPQLLRTGDVAPATLMNVVNAVYFQADWLHGFDPANTQNAPFRRADGSTVQVPMMHSNSTTLRTAEQSNAVLVELPYRSGEISFLAWLPASEDGVPALEDMLVNSKLSDWIAQLQETKHVVALPRFKLHARRDLIPTLESLGVVDIFHDRVADLSGIDGARDLYVDKFVQEALISVDEQGTVVAAATVAGLTRGVSVPIQFDHPFVFFIYDHRSGSVLFTGRVTDPTESD